MKAEAVAFPDGGGRRFQAFFERSTFELLGPDKIFRVEGPGDHDIAFRDVGEMSDEVGFCFDLKDHFFLEGMADQVFIEVRDRVKGEAVGQFAGPHAEEAVRCFCDERVDFPGDIFNIHVDRDQRNIEIILENAISAIQRAVGLGIDCPIAAAKILRARGGAGFEEIAFEPGDPETFFSGRKRHFFKASEEGFFVRDERDRDALQLLQNAAGEGRGFGCTIKENAFYAGVFFRGHGFMVTAPLELEKRKIIISPKIMAIITQKRKKRFFVERGAVVRIRFSLAWGKSSLSPKKYFKSPEAYSLLNEYTERVAHFMPCEIGPYPCKGSKSCVWVCEREKGSRALSSEALAQELQKCMNSGVQELQIVIGGPDGFKTTELGQMAPALRWSFGPMTLPHELAAVVAAEQLYRALTILHHQPYHSGH